jgi:hypothetical protein
LDSEVKRRSEQTNPPITASSYPYPGRYVAQLQPLLASVSKVKVVDLVIDFMENLPISKILLHQIMAPQSHTLTVRGVSSCGPRTRMHALLVASRIGFVRCAETDIFVVLWCRGKWH